MIVRMWECSVKAGAADGLITHVERQVWPNVQSAAGFLGGEMLRSVARDQDRLLLVTRWADVESLERFLGPGWTAHELTPVPEEEVYIDGVPFVDNWALVTSIGDDGSSG